MKSTTILRELGLEKGTCAASFILRAVSLANDEGTIQASDMLLLASDPTLHTTSNLRDVLLRAGCVEGGE